MSANIETMFYFGETPWHGLGTKVDHALTSKEALVAAGLDWTVNPVPIQLATGDFAGSVINNAKANVRSSDGKVLGLVTDRYKIVQNADAFAFTDNLIGEGVTYETAGSLASGQRVWLLSKLEKTKIMGDEVIPYLVFTNSFDGSGAVKAAITPVRVVCQNTLTFALRNSERSFSMKHTSNIDSRITEAQQVLFNTEKYMKYFNQRANELSEIVVVDPQFMDFLTTMFPIKNDDSGRVKQNMEEKREAFSSLYKTKDDLKPFRGTVYGILNAVGDFEPHAVPQRQTKNYQENNFLNIADGAKQSLMARACAYFGA